MSDTTYVDPEGTEGESLAAGGVEGVLDELIDIVSSAKSMPLSSSVLIPREEVLDLVEAARDEFPEELRRARRLLKDREDVLAAARREATEIIEDARVHAERMVQRTEIVRQAEHRAVRLVEDAEAECRRMRHEADDYIDQKLAAFEIVLDRTTKTVRAGRERLASVPADGPDVDQEAEEWFEGQAREAEGFFDQDEE
ncbi:MAG: ATP synthase F0 subunit B [Acidimicrobiales bacterium]